MAKRTVTLADTVAQALWSIEEELVPTQVALDNATAQANEAKAKIKQLETRRDKIYDRVKADASVAANETWKRVDKAKGEIEVGTEAELNPPPVEPVPVVVEP